MRRLISIGLAFSLLLTLITSSAPAESGALGGSPSSPKDSRDDGLVTMVAQAIGKTGKTVLVERSLDEMAIPQSEKDAIRQAWARFKAQHPDAVVQKVGPAASASTQAVRIQSLAHTSADRGQCGDTGGFNNANATLISGETCTYGTSLPCSNAQVFGSQNVAYNISGHTISMTAAENNTGAAIPLFLGTYCDFATIIEGNILSQPERNCARCTRTMAGNNPIDITNGEDFYQKTDVAFSGPFGLSFTRSYASLTQGGPGSLGATNAPASDIGNNWRHNYTQRLYLGAPLTYYDETNLPFYFSSKPAAGGSVYDNISGLTIALSSDASTWTLRSFDNRVWTFNAKGELTGLKDRVGNAQTVTRDTAAGHNDRILNVSDPLGRRMCFYYDASNRITGLSWQGSGACPSAIPTTGTVVSFTYDAGKNCATGQLCAATEPDGKTWTYQYTNAANKVYPNDLIEVDDPLGNPEEVNAYNNISGQVANQHTGKCATTFPCGDVGGDLSFDYSSNAYVTTVTDGLNRKTTFAFDYATYLLTQIAGPLCNCGGDQTRSYAYDGSERTTTVTDDGADGKNLHTFTYSYGRDAGGKTYPGPTKIVENLDAKTTRTTTIQYYGIGDARQDLPYRTTLPSVDKPGSTMSITDSYSTGGLLTQRSKTGYINGVATTYNWAWAYDSRGRVTQSTGPRTTTPVEVTKYTYFSDTDTDHAQAGQLSTVTDALGHVTKFATQSGFTSYDVFGNPQSMTDPNGVGTTYTYDARGRKLTSTLLGVAGDSTNLTTTWAYDAAGRLTKIVWPKGNAVTLGYDTSSRVTTAVRLDAANAQHERLVFAHNYNDQVTARYAQSCTTPATSCGGWTNAWYASYAYSSTTGNLTQLTNADNTYKKFTYIPSGPVATLNDENHTTGSDYTYAYDIAGRRITETRVLGTGTVLTSYAYDLHDNVSSVTDPNGNATSYHYDDFDRVTKETSPVQGVTTYAYDADSNLTSMTDSNGATTAYAYDSLNRPLTENAIKGSTTLASAWTYDDATSGHFGIGRLATMTDPSGSSAYTYERHGMLAVENRQITGKLFTLSYAYDGNADRASVTYPDGYVVNTGYDWADRPSTSGPGLALSAAQLAALAASGLAAPSHTAMPELHGAPTTAGVTTIAIGGARSATGKISVGAGAAAVSIGPGAASTQSKTAKPLGVVPSNFVTSATYKPFGPIASIVYGNGTTQTLSWNTRYFPTENKLSFASTLADYTYAEDKVGNITGITDAVNAAYDRTFAYDDLNRLTTANSGASLWGTATGNGYTYDPMGNIKTLQLGGSRKDAFTYKAGGTGSTGLPEIAKVVENGATRNVTYDAFGNETNDGKSAFAYSPRELLGSDSRFVSSYYYDGFRKRVATKLSAAGNHQRDSFFDGTRLLAETNQFTTTAPTIEYKYVWLGDRPVAQVDSTGTHWTFADHLGTPLIQTDLTAKITWQAEYEPYGNVWAVRTGSTLHQPLRLPGQSSEQFDSGNNGLTERNYNNARWYRPAWGRYTQADPIRLQDRENLFEYAIDDPIAATDPTGLFPRPKTRTRFCTPIERDDCRESCASIGKKMESCRVQQIWTAVAIGKKDWKDTSVSCSCEDNHGCGGVRHGDPVPAPPPSVDVNKLPPWWKWLIPIITRPMPLPPIPIPA